MFKPLLLMEIWDSLLTSWMLIKSSVSSMYCFNCIHAKKKNPNLPHKQLITTTEILRSEYCKERPGSGLDCILGATIGIQETQINVEP